MAWRIYELLQLITQRKIAVTKSWVVKESHGSGILTNSYLFSSHLNDFIESLRRLCKKNIGDHGDKFPYIKYSIEKFFVEEISSPPEEERERRSTV